MLRLNSTDEIQQVDDTWGSRLSLNGKLEISTSRLERPWKKVHVCGTLHL